MIIVKYRKIFYAISGILVLASIASLFIWGLNVGIDFKGGAILEVNYPTTKLTIDDINKELTPLNLGEFSVRATGDTGYIIRLRDLTENERVSLMNALTQNGKVKIEQKRFDSIGPILGQEALYKSFTSIALVLICIVLFIAFAFRKVSLPVSSWKYGLIAVVALIHDVIIPIGIVSVLGHFFGFEADTLFVTAILVVLGFSVHDTIVVFDRVRENLKIKRELNLKESFEETVGKSINQTFVRSINTSFTVLLSLLALFFFGSEATRHFSLILIIGVVFGTYSSIFLGSPLLVTVEKWQNRN